MAGPGSRLIACTHSSVAIVASMVATASSPARPNREDLIGARTARRKGDPRTTLAQQRATIPPASGMLKAARVNSRGR
jgi:hypothetical protein